MGRLPAEATGLFKTDAGFQAIRRGWPRKSFAGRLCFERHPKHFPDRPSFGSNRFVQNRCLLASPKARVAEKIAFGPAVFQVQPGALPRPTFLPEKQACSQPMPACKAWAGGAGKKSSRTDGVGNRPQGISLTGTPFEATSLLKTHTGSPVIRLVAR